MRSDFNKIKKNHLVIDHWQPIYALVTNTKVNGHLTYIKELKEKEMIISFGLEPQYKSWRRKNNDVVVSTIIGYIFKFVLQIMSQRHFIEISPNVGISIAFISLRKKNLISSAFVDNVTVVFFYLYLLLIYLFLQFCWISLKKRRKTTKNIQISNHYISITLLNKAFFSDQVHSSMFDAVFKNMT